jgi:AraC-like DNA-binding protein
VSRFASATDANAATLGDVSAHFTLPPAWRTVLKDLGIDGRNVLRRAGLPPNLFAQDTPKLDAAAYFRLWRAVEEEDGRPALPVRIGEALSMGTLDPPLFAALSCPDLNTALERLAQYKPLIGPLTLTVERTPEHTRIELGCLELGEPMPLVLIAVELVYYVLLARGATREPIRPLRVRTREPLTPVDDYRRFFGAKMEVGVDAEILFDAADARRPFLTANDAMWRFFEPELQRQLEALQAGASASDGLRAALLELLPSGRSSIEHASASLGLTPRTLQRRLRAEGTSFREILDETREKLSLQYLRRSHLTLGEISFLLGYDDPNSFFRAFRQWTGQTPEAARSALRGRA